jgi:alanine racemase
MHGALSSLSARTTASGILTIDLAALGRNYAALSTRLAPTIAGAVVKADAYGLGADRVAPVLYAHGCRDFFVAHLDEALALKDVLAGDVRLFVLNGLVPGAEGRCAEANIVPVLNCLDQATRWAQQAAMAGRELPAILQFDTGMSRLGLAESEVRTLTDRPDLLAGVRVLFVMSHLASADEPDNEQNPAQLAAMRRLADRFPRAALCFANSGGIFLGAAYHGALARPGIALYGGAPTAGVANPMTPVVRLDVRVIQIRTVPAGTRVGYGGVHVTSAERRLATIACGYADGFPRHLSDRGAVYCGDVRLPIVGRVSMDSTTVDISALPDGTLAPGSLVEVIGPHQSLESIAADAGTISYEILTRLGPRYHRCYCNHQEPS